MFSDYNRLKKKSIIVRYLKFSKEKSEEYEKTSRMNWKDSSGKTYVKILSYGITIYQNNIKQKEYYKSPNSKF